MGITVAAGPAAHEAAAQTSAPSWVTYQYRPFAEDGVGLPLPRGEMALDDDGTTVGWSSAMEDLFTVAEEEEDERAYLFGVADRGSSRSPRKLQVLDVPGIIQNTSPIDADLSGDGQTFVSVFRSDTGDAGLGCATSPSGADAGYHEAQVVAWERATATGEFGGPQLISRADGSAGCEGTNPDGGPDLIGVGGDRRSISTAVSTDGEVIAFASMAENLVASPPTGTDAHAVYVAEGSGGSRSVSLVTPTNMDGAVFDIAMSGDGNSIAFVSSASNLVPGVTIPPDSTQVYLASRTTPSGPWAFSIVSQAADGAVSDSWISSVAIDDEGERVAYTAYSRELDDSVETVGADVMAVVSEVSTGSTQVVPHVEPTSGGSLQAPDLGFLAHVDISPDGERVAVVGIGRD
ncbi:MAG TPA: hypothetical protein VF228_07975, partial [Iamia sp.]